MQANSTAAALHATARNALKGRLCSVCSLHTARPARYLQEAKWPAERQRERYRTQWPRRLHEGSSPSSSKQVETAPSAGAVLSSRTHHCGALRESDDGKRVTLSGWKLPLRRISKSLAFFPLNDAHGATQIVARSPDEGTSPGGSTISRGLLDQLEDIPQQSVISVEGTVRVRPVDMRNLREATGAIEVEIHSFQVLNRTERSVLPFDPFDQKNLAGEELRAQYRYLDLRRPALARNIQLRSRVAHTVRKCLHQADFSEVETPILLRSTPEGAAEFLVPTRIAKQRNRTDTQAEPLFYALPQSPQQPKQLLIASGCVDRYYQFAKCFRDEDSRKDRQVEFTQIDMEMGFITTRADAGSDWTIGGREIRETVEGMMKTIWSEPMGKDLGKGSLPVLTYQQAMSTFGSDKPDRRFGLHIHDLRSALISHDGEGIDEHIQDTIEIMVCPSLSQLSNKVSAQLMKEIEADRKGTRLERFKVPFESQHELTALLLKKSGLVADLLRRSELNASEVDVDRLAARCSEALSAVRSDPIFHGSEDALIFVSSRPLPAVGGSTVLGDLRLKIANHLESNQLAIRQQKDDMFWVTEFPLFSRDSDPATGELLGWSSTHHPFTAPVSEDMPLLQSARLTDDLIGQIRGQHYDLVLNGTEIGGGSVRIHQADVQEKIMRDVLGLSDQDVKGFEHLLHALRCGAPPHGGIALGFDRLMAILCGAPSIRDVIAFPKTSSGVDPVFGSPAPAAAQATASSFASGAPQGATRTAADVLSEYGLRTL